MLFAVAWVLIRGRLGRSLRAVRDSEIASTANGVSAMWVKTLAFGLSAFYCGVAGALFAIGDHLRQSGHVPDRPLDPALDGIVIGGTGSLGGMVFGALFVEFIRISWAPSLVHLFTRVTTVHVNTHAPGSALGHLRDRAAARALRRPVRRGRASFAALVGLGRRATSLSPPRVL